MWLSLIESMGMLGLRSAHTQTHTQSSLTHTHREWGCMVHHVHCLYWISTYKYLCAFILKSYINRHCDLFRCITLRWRQCCVIHTHTSHNITQHHTHIHSTPYTHTHTLHCTGSHANAYIHTPGTLATMMEEAAAAAPKEAPAASVRVGVTCTCVHVCTQRYFPVYTHVCARMLRLFASTQCVSVKACVCVCKVRSTSVIVSCAFFIACVCIYVCMCSRPCSCLYPCGCVSLVHAPRVLYVRTSHLSCGCDLATRVDRVSSIHLAYL